MGQRPEYRALSDPVVTSERGMQLSVVRGFERQSGKPLAVNCVENRAQTMGFVVEIRARGKDQGGSKGTPRARLESWDELEGQEES